LTPELGNLIGKTVSHYRILHELGRGGMGEVFLAQDLNLPRKAALKFLHSNRLQDPIARARFTREARAAASIDHPYVCKIYETGESEGRTFIAMEYVEGQTLRAKLTEGMLPLKDALLTAAETAEALEEIHNRQIVHRDVKPSNIVLSRHGHVKVMDFGIAKQIPSVVTTAETVDYPAKTRIVGTVAYMAPEQLRGTEADERSDIFSFGVVLYEMICGVHPFKKKTSRATINSILREEPAPVARYRTEIPETLEEILKRMLAKKPAQRFRWVREVRNRLNQLLEARQLKVKAAAAGPSIAVLPFVNVSTDPENEYFSDGLAEELINVLCRIPGLHVTSRTSAFQFKGKALDIRTIGEQLNVSTILEGSVRKSGDRLRITGQLINVANGFQLWSERYDREMKDIFEIQDDISGAIADQLRARIMSDPKEPVLKGHTDNPEAYNLYLKGRYFWNKRTEEALHRSVRYFKLALEKDRDYALAYAGMAAAHLTQSIYGLRPPNELMPKAKSAAEEALAIENQLPSALVSRGCVRSMYDWDWAAAESDFKRAIELEPRNEYAYHCYANHCLIPLGRFREASLQLRLAREIDPLNLVVNTSAGLPFFFGREFDKAIEEYQKTIEMDHNFGLARYFLGQAYTEKTMYPQAIAELKQVIGTSGQSPEYISALGQAYALAEKIEEALGQLDQLRRLSEVRYVSPVLFAQVHLAMNQNDLAQDYLETAYRMRCTDLIWIQVRPVFDRLRGNARFGDLCRKIGFP